MRPALQIQAEFNIGGEVPFDSRPAEVAETWAMARADDQVKAAKGNYCDYDYALKEILFLHYEN